MARFDACLPATQPEHAIVGGGTTVGLSAMVLAYVLGYRKLHLYGYDSSYRAEATHAYAQHDPQRVDCVATVAGRKFRTSLAMAKQAELFPTLADSLIDLGCLITIRGDGLAAVDLAHGGADGRRGEVQGHVGAARVSGSVSRGRVRRWLPRDREALRDGD
jgi:hypothetical protein